MAMAPRTPSSRPPWTAWTFAAAAEVEEVGEALLVLDPVSTDAEVAAAEAEVALVV